MNKLTLATLILMSSLSTAAFAADSDLAPLKLSSPCEAKLTKQVLAVCNRDSKSDPDREHSCLYSELNIIRNQTDSSYFEINFTVNDAIVYAYGVSIQSKDKCVLKIVSKN